MKKLAVLALIVIISAFSFSQSINVTFQVDMRWQILEGNFSAGANLVVRGSFQSDFGDPDGNWQGSLFQLSDPDDDTVYTGTFNAPTSLTGNTYIFKFVIVNPPAGDNWESISDRQFTLTSPATILPVVWFNNDSFYVDFVITNTLNFTADISSILGVGFNGSFDPFQDSLLVMGLDWDQMGNYVIGNRRMYNTETNPGIYKTTLIGNFVIFNDSTRWKFKAYPDDRFMNLGWEFGADRWHIYEPDNTIIDLPTIVPRILPALDTLNHTVDLTINVDMTSAVNRFNGEPIPINSIENVIITGSEQFVGMYEPPSPPYPCYCIDDTAQGYIKILTHSNGNVWAFHTIIPVGQTCGLIEYQFGVSYPGYDTINGGNSNILNELPPFDHHVFTLTNQWDSTVLNNYFGNIVCCGVERIENLTPSNYELNQNYPNPFNPLLL